MNEFDNVDFKDDDDSMNNGKNITDVDSEDIEDEDGGRDRHKFDGKKMRIIFSS